MQELKINDEITLDGIQYTIIGVDPTIGAIHAVDIQPRWDYLLIDRSGNRRRVRKRELIDAGLIDSVDN